MLRKHCPTSSCDYITEDVDLGVALCQLIILDNKYTVVTDLTLPTGKQKSSMNAILIIEKMCSTSSNFAMNTCRTSFKITQMWPLTLSKTY